jgi:hypothetical protein
VLVLNVRSSETEEENVIETLVGFAVTLLKFPAQPIRYSEPVKTIFPPQRKLP